MAGAYEETRQIAAAMPETSPSDVLRLISLLDGKSRAFCRAAIDGATFDEAAGEAGLDAEEIAALLPQLRAHFAEHLLN
jgi:hypothetical protein